MIDKLKDIFPDAPFAIIKGIAEDIEYQSDAQIRHMIEDICCAYCEGLKHSPNLSNTSIQWLDSMGDSQRSDFAKVLYSLINGDR